MNAWETVIGLEVHVQLNTRTKLFCQCRTDAGGPNSRVCPVCLGLPGALPVVNGGAVELGVRAALALECTIHATSEFARKNYFYPDLPKGYQISQFERPVATGGRLVVESDRGPVVIGVDRLHLEEDAGKSIHDRVPERTALDFNRAGTPLAEIVTAPDLRSPAEAREFLNRLKRILRYLRVSECNMEEGQLRVDGNLSVRPAGASELGVKQEVKNLNSFAGVERSLLELESAQTGTLSGGGSVTPATFSGATDVLVLMRTKEQSDDYRYFPEPDLPLLVMSPGRIAEIREALPELPEARCARLIGESGVAAHQAAVITDDRERADYFEAVVAAGVPPADAANWVTGPVLKDFHACGGQFRVPADAVGTLIGLAADGTLSGQAARKVFAALAQHGGDPRQRAEDLGLIQIDDAAAVTDWLKAAVRDHPEEWARFKAGEDKLAGFFMGRVMRASGGRANPDAIKSALDDIR